MQSSELPFVVAIVGPTAVGKTDLALSVARRIGGEIVSADSRLFYRGMDIGTAKPTLEERLSVPHHLMDVVEPDDTWSLAVFQKGAEEAIADILERGRIPMLVGGTGQFIRSILEGWQPPKQAPDTRLRTALERWGEKIGAVEMHKKVAILDAEAAAHIEPRNLRRSVRALEVILLTGEKFSAQRLKSRARYRVCTIGLDRPRDALYQRIDLRIDRMIVDGLLEETRKLLEKGYAPNLPAFSAIGYREMVEVLQGKITLEDAVILMKRNTRIFVRRQSNWFKLSDKSIQWFRMTPETVDNVISYIIEQAASR